MHRKTAAALTQLKKALTQAERLEQCLQRAAACNPPVYWQLNPALLRQIMQLKCALEREILELAELSKK